MKGVGRVNTSAKGLNLAQNATSMTSFTHAATIAGDEQDLVLSQDVFVEALEHFQWSVCGYIPNLEKECTRGLCFF